MELKINKELETTLRLPESILHDSLWMPDRKIHGYRFRFRAESWYQYRFFQEKARGSIAAIKDDPLEYVVQKVELLSEDVREDKLNHAIFNVEIAERDDKPVFQVVQVDTISLAVKRYASRIDDKSMVHRFLVEMNQDKFDKLANALQVHRKTALHLQRMGVDEAPLQGRFDNGNPWSRVEDRGTVRYLRVLNFIMDRKEASDRRSRAHIRVNNLERKVANLSFKLEYLLKRMQHSLNEEDLRILSATKPPVGVSSQAIVSFWTDLDRTDDANRYFGDGD